MIEEIIKIAKQAGVKILEHYNDEIEVTHKEDESPLTKADLVAHHEIVNGIRSIDSDTPIISEESGVPEYDKRKNWSRFWIVDPLDGTKEFIKRNGEFTVNIALIEHGEPVLGVVHTPAMDLTYYAKKGSGSYKQNGDEMPVRIFSDLADKSKPLSMIESRSHGSAELEEFLEIENLNIVERVKSGSSLKLCLVAEGKADFYPRMAPTMEWDVAAGDCVYRNSAREGQHPSELEYNKENLLNPSFIIGF